MVFIKNVVAINKAQLMITKVNAALGFIVPLGISLIWAVLGLAKSIFQIGRAHV